MKESSIQEIIMRSLSEKSRVCFHAKRGYRTNTVKGPELYGKICALRRLLQKNGLKKGDKIIILGYGSIEWAIVYFSCILSGIAVVPLDVMSDKKLFQKIQQQVQSKAVFHSASIDLSPSKSLKRFYLENLDEIIKSIPANDIPIANVSPEEVLEIQYTSGTTGEPKGVILTHSNVFSAVNAAVGAVNIKLHLRFLNILPLSHVYSQVIGIFLPLFFEWEIFFIDTVQPRKIISFIHNKRIHCAIFVPGILAALKKELEGRCVHCSLGFWFRMIGVGGASLDPELERWWKRKLIFVLQGYGMTETCSIIALNAPFASKTASAGKIAGAVSVKINNDGEILVKGDNVTLGYYKNEAKTRDSFENGWFKTGDIGEIKKAYLYIRERKKDIIVTGNGLKVYPADIEPVLNSLKGVREGCVLEKDKKIHAVLILNEGANAQEIIKRANGSLMSHQQIADYTVWPENDFPKTPIGKVKKFALLQDISNSERLAHKKIAYENNIYGVVDQVLKPGRKISKNSKLSDLGMDSLKRVELISELENKFSIEIDELAVNQNTTASELERIVGEKQISRAKFMAWPLSRFAKSLRFIFKNLLMYYLIRIFTRTEYLHTENLEAINSPVIFVSNHQSALDVPLITKKIKMPLSVAADSEVVFGIGLKKPMERLLRKILGYYSAFAYNAYPFGAAIGTDKSLEFTGEMLDRGYSILLFPEGERTLDGKIHDFKPGIGYIVSNMKAAVVPIKIDGLFDIMPLGRIIPRFGKTKIIYGKPVIFDGKKIAKMSYEGIAAAIEKGVRAL